MNNTPSENAAKTSTFPLASCFGVKPNKFFNVGFAPRASRSAIISE